MSKPKIRMVAALLCLLYLLAGVVPATAFADGRDSAVQTDCNWTVEDLSKRQMGYDANGVKLGSLYQTDADGTATGKVGFDRSVLYYKVYVPSYESYLTVYTRDTTGAKDQISVGIKGNADYHHTYTAGENAFFSPPKVIPGDNVCQITVTPENGGTARVYTLDIVQMAQGEMPSIEKIKGDGSFVSAGLSVGQQQVPISMKNKGDTCTLTLTPSAGARLYTAKPFDEASLLTDNTLKWNNADLTVYAVGADGAYYEYTLTAGSDQGGYRFPDAVASYIPSPGQFTSVANDVTIGAEKTLLFRGPLSLLGSCTGTTYEGQVGIAWTSGVSLGNFGGTITYRFDQPVENSPNNPYGVDFIVYGNSSAYNDNGRNSMAFAEPAQVWVSQDGNQWYAIAGSDHYMDSTIWDYQINYQNMGDGYTDYTDNRSVTERRDIKGGASQYAPSLKPVSTVSMQGVYLDLNAMTTNNIAFGYGDSHINVWTDKFDQMQVNPYRENFYKDPQGDPIDISWAVDKDGLPVKLDSVKYVKLQTATFVYAGALGEKSSEIVSVVAVKPGSSAVKTTKAPAYLKIGGQAIDLQGGVYTYPVDFAGYPRVEVGVDQGVNVYINEMYGASRTFAEYPQKGLIRVIVQQGNGEPLIYYLVNKSGPLENSGEKTAVRTASTEGTFQKEIQVCVSLEKFTLGQGYVVEPMLVTVPDGATAAQTLTLALDQAHRGYKNTGSLKSQFYLSYVEDGGGQVAVPAFIQNALGESLGGKKYSDYLGEFDYSRWSGWMYAVNNVFPSVGSSDLAMRDQDVMRWQYTLYGYGADVGAGNDEWGMPNLKELADKDDLTWAIAQINGLACRDAVLKLGDNQQKYDAAMKALTNMESTQAQVDAALAGLEGIGNRDQVLPVLSVHTQSAGKDQKACQLSAAVDGTQVDGFDYKIKTAIPYAALGVQDSAGLVLCGGAAGNSSAPVVWAWPDDAKQQWEVVTDRPGTYILQKAEDPFSDISSDPHADAIRFLAERGVVEGNGRGNFFPERAMTTGELLQILTNLDRMQMNKVTTDLCSKLQSDGSLPWYGWAQAWAVSKGILSGSEQSSYLNAPLTGAGMNRLLGSYAEKIEGKPIAFGADADQNAKVTRSQAAEAVVNLIKNLYS